MGLDIRWPIGPHVHAHRRTAHRRRRGRRRERKVARHQHQLIWGVVLLVFGALMLLGAVRGGKNPPSA